MEQFELERLRCRVTAIVYKNDDTGYCVARVKTEDDDVLTVVGNMPALGAGEQLDAEGVYISHPQYGRQFSVRTYERSMPDDTSGIFEYLAAGAVKGIGAKTAQLIVQKFGKRAFEVIANEPETLATLRGISLEKAYNIQRSFLQASALRALVEFLTLHRLPPQYASPLLNRYGGDAIEAVTHDPYLLCSEPFDAAFGDIDSLAAEFGIEQDSDVRLDAAVLYELGYNLQNGHVFIPTNKLIAVSADLAKVNVEQIEASIPRLEKSMKIVRRDLGEHNVCYLACAYSWETIAVREISRLVSLPVHVPKGLGSKLDALMNSHGINCSDRQRQAILGCFDSGVSIITGGPGTGKTTALLAAVELMEKCGRTYLLAAPTGRAADRMTKICHRQAATLHRLLEACPDDMGGMGFRRHSSNPLDADFVIVDEASMIDLSIAAALLSALKPHTRLVLVGDADQLPPVGAGRFFKDLIDSNLVPATRLDEIFRQAQQSDIVMNAHMINSGVLPPLRKNSGDFYFSPSRTAQGAAQAVAELVHKRIPDRFGIEDIQVICPSRRNTCGTEELNALLQSRLNPEQQGKTQLKSGRVIFRTGDKVMQTRNNYDRTWYNAADKQLGAGIYNGDMGVILDVDERGKLVSVSFDGRVTEYALAELDELEHAFAITAHKSQGSEYAAVIIPVFDCPSRLLMRNLLYTAVTRAKELLVLVGREDMIETMVNSGEAGKRYSALKRRLRDHD
ncbi:MAG: ATP-dependent RecD-like DNA helicase [Clostridia bacterium]|nr:ATP-dependent RecD-like DNA helicase [Clostridia bacterium]